MRHKTDTDVMRDVAPPGCPSPWGDAHRRDRQEEVPKDRKWEEQTRGCTAHGSTSHKPEPGSQLGPKRPLTSIMFFSLRRQASCSPWALAAPAKAETGDSLIHLDSNVGH